MHTKELLELLAFAAANMLCAVENRDSSEMCQAFDRWVAKAGKKRGREAIDLLRRSNINPIVDQWALVIVGLAMLRDCDQSNVWECSFIAVNMHPLYRISLEDWLDKIRGFTRAAEKFDDEVIDLSSMLPKAWLQTPLSKRQGWLKTIKDHDEEYDVDLIGQLRKEGMSLALVSNIFRIYEVEKKIKAGNAVTTFKSKTASSTPETLTKPKPGQMIYHSYKLPSSYDATPTEKFEHAITVRNRVLGPTAGTTVSPYLDVEVTETNQSLLRLKPEDVNMYKVLQESTCKVSMRRKVAKRTLTALGSASGMCGILNGPEQLKKLKANLQFAQSVEECRAREKELRQQAADARKQKQTKAKEKKEARAESLQKKRQMHYDKALEKLGLPAGATVYRHHVNGLTGPQLKAVAFFQVGETLTGNVSDIKTAMRTLLPFDPSTGVPEFPTQEDVYEEEPDSCTSDESSEETTASDIIEFEDLYLADIVEVYWEGENKWFEGTITDVDAVDRQFEVFYKSDSKKLWHEAKYYPVRTAA